METLSYADFSLGIHRWAQARRVPVNGTIEVTHRCPLRCVHCYNNLPLADREARSSELTYEEHCRILDEITEAGCLWLLFTGGEIFSRRDFLDIYTHAKQKGLLITLFTNGTLIDERIADYLSGLRPFSIEITLYGRTRKTYERITGVPGSYERCIRGIHLLIERGLPLKLKTMAITWNKHEIWEMKRFAKEELGLPFKYDAMINPRVDCSQGPLAVRLGPEEIVILDMEDPERGAEWKGLAERLTSFEHPPKSSDELYRCNGGLSSFAIDPGGRMSLCVLSPVEAWDLRRGSFRQGWEGFLSAVRKKKVTRPTKCVRCEMRPICGMCPPNGALENGDPEEPVDFLCHVAHLRAQVLDFPVKPHGACEFCDGGSRHKNLMQSVAAVKRAVTSGTISPASRKR